MKDLPKVFANPINKDLNNNRSYSYDRLEEKTNDRNEGDVQNKINKLFKNEQTIYSIDCIIKFANEEGKYSIIGKTNNNLVTKNQKIIPIKDIYDIELAEK